MNEKSKLTLPPLKTAQERADFLRENIPDTLSNRQLETCANYILEALPKEERLNHKILTPNRLKTINKRETSYEGLAAGLEGGEDTLHILSTQTPRQYLTNRNAAKVGPQELEIAIQEVENKRKTATLPLDRYLLTKAAIELRQSKYLTESDNQTMYLTPTPLYVPEYSLNLRESRWVDANGEPHSDGLLDLFNSKHIAALLINYEFLSTFANDRIDSDMHFFFADFDTLIHRALSKEPYLLKIAKWKILGKTNNEIQQLLLENFGISHTQEYISELWTQKIPETIAFQAKKDFIYQTYSSSGKVKRCTKCLKQKPQHLYFFSKSPATKDGWYTICKECRKKRKD